MRKSCYSLINSSQAAAWMLHTIFGSISPNRSQPTPASSFLAANPLPALFHLPSQRTARIIIQRNILHCDLLMRFMWTTYFSHNDVSLLPQIYMLHVLLAHYIQTARWCPVIYFTATGDVHCFTFSLMHEYDKPFNRMIFHANAVSSANISFHVLLSKLPGHFV